MCRNITTLRGLEPPATTEEIEAGARQYVRKVSGVTSTSSADAPTHSRTTCRSTCHETSMSWGAMKPR